MADKSEAPTPRRIREARLRGQVAKSPLLVVGAMTGVLGLMMRAVDPTSFGELLEPARAVAMGASFEQAQASLTALALDALFTTLGPLLALLVCAAVAMNLLQTGPVFAPKALERRPGDALAFTSPKAWIALLKTLVVLAVLLGVVALTLQEMLHGLGTLPLRSSAFTLEALMQVQQALLERCATAMLTLGVLDLVHRRSALLRSLQMTKEEVQREQKNSEGDPDARVERHRRGRDAASDPLDAILSCGLVVWSRERFLVGLAYDRESDEGAPRIVVRGSGQVAVTLRAFAQHHGVYELQDDVLAKRLFGLDALPEDAFEVVAAALQRAWQQGSSASSDL